MNFLKLCGQATGGNKFCEQFWFPSNDTHSHASTLIRAKMKYLTKKWLLTDDLLTGTLFVIPPEIREHIFTKLRVKDLAAFMQVNSYWYDLIIRTNSVWCHVFQSEMPDTIAYLSKASAMSAYEGVKKQTRLWPSLFREEYAKQKYFQTDENEKILRLEAQDNSLYICTNRRIIKKTDNVFKTLSLQSLKDRDETDFILENPLLFNFKNNTLYIAYSQSISEVRDSPEEGAQITENLLLKQALVINELAVSNNFLFIAGWEWSESTIPLYPSHLSSEMIDDLTTGCFPTNLSLEIHMWELHHLDAPRQIIKFTNPLLENLFAFDDKLIANFIEPGENSPFESRLLCWQSVPSFSSETQFGTIREIKLESQARCFTLYNEEIFIGMLDRGIYRFDFENLTMAAMDLGSAWPILEPKQILCYDGKILTQLFSGEIACTDISTGQLKGFLPSKKWEGMTILNGHPVCFTENTVFLLEGT